MSEPADQTESIFAAAVALPTPSARAAYLKSACGGDARMLARLEALLRAHEETGHLLDHPAPVELEQTRTLPVLEQRPGTIIAGRYKLLEAIGEGGMGSVWVAEQSHPVKRKVAVKLIKAGMDSKSVLARFEAERQALAVMDHPNIAKVLDGGATEQGRPYFVMEYVKGIPITEYCDAKRMSVPDRLRLFAQVCQAVQHAHQKGIIHRDLKPSNILVAPYDDLPVPKVIDFGLAKAMHQSLTEKTLHTAHDMVLGTPLYMSPEQAQLNNIDIDTRSDVYSLGVLLYEMLTGTTPLEKQRFKQAAWDEIRRIIREEDPPLPSLRLSSAETLPSVAAGRHTEPQRLTRLVRGELDWIVMKALDKDRTRRYETANGFAADVLRYLAGEPIMAAPPSTTYRLQKFIRRHQAEVIAASLVLLALLLGIAGTSWQWYRAEKLWASEAIQREKAEEKERDAEKARGEAVAATESERKAKIRAETNEALAEARLVQVQQEQQRTENEKRIAQAVRDFLQKKLLGQADATNQADAILGLDTSEIAWDENPRIRDLLARAADELAPDRIEVNFPNQPLLQAELLETVGSTYTLIGGRDNDQYSQAIRLLERAVALRKDQLGAEHVETLASMHRLAFGYMNSGKLDQALSLLMATVEARKKTLGPDHADTLDSMFHLGLGYRVAGKLELALPLFEETLSLTKKTLGPNHSRTLTCVNGLAGGYAMVGLYDKALPLFEEALKLSTLNLGPDHPHTLISMNNLASGYHDVGQLDKALPLYESTMILTKAKLGSDHPRTLIIMNNLAIGYKAIGRLDKALPLHQETLTLTQAKLGPDHPDTLTSMLNLALGYQAASQLHEALPRLEALLPMMTAKLGRDHPYTLETMGGLALCYQDTGQLDKALPILEEAFALSKAKLGKDHPNTLDSMSNLAWGYYNANQLDKALPLFEETLSLAKAKLGPDHPDTIASLGNLANGYKEAGELDKALPLLRETLELETAKLGADHPHTLIAMNNLARGYQAANQMDKALPLLEETLKLRRAKLGPDHVHTLNSVNNLAEAFQVIGETAKALPLSEEALAIVRRTAPLNEPKLAGALAQHGMLLVITGAFGEAESILREALAIRERTQPEAWTTFQTQSLLGGSLLGQERYVEAEPLLIQGYEGLQARKDTIPTVAASRLPEAIKRLVQLYEATNRPDEAAAWRTKLNE